MPPSAAAAACRPYVRRLSLRGKLSRLALLVFVSAPLSNLLQQCRAADSIPDIPSCTICWSTGDSRWLAFSGSTTLQRSASLLETTLVTGSCGRRRAPLLWAPNSAAEATRGRTGAGKVYIGAFALCCPCSVTLSAQGFLAHGDRKAGERAKRLGVTTDLLRRP